MASLSVSDYIALASDFITLVAMAVSIFFAMKAVRTSDLIEKKFRKISVIDVRVHLEEALRIGNELPARITGAPRGQRVELLTQPLRHSLTQAISRLPPSGAERELREFVRMAQTALTNVESGPVPDRLANLQICIAATEDALGTCHQLYETADSKES